MYSYPPKISGKVTCTSEEERLRGWVGAGTLSTYTWAGYPVHIHSGLGTLSMYHGLGWGRYPLHIHMGWVPYPHTHGLGTLSTYTWAGYPLHKYMGGVPYPQKHGLGTLSAYTWAGLGQVPSPHTHGFGPDGHNHLQELPQEQQAAGRRHSRQQLHHRHRQCCLE
jgi:hypothetical protein